MDERGLDRKLKNRLIHPARHQPRFGGQSVFGMGLEKMFPDGRRTKDASAAQDNQSNDLGTTA